MLSAIWEAVAFEKPFITSYSETIYQILGNTPLYFNPYKRRSLENILNKLYCSECLGEVARNVSVFRKHISSVISQQLTKVREFIGT
mgnify:CR=1 FL=1